MLYVDHQSAMINACVSNFNHENTLCGLESERGKKGLARMKRQESEPNANFLNLLLCWNDCER